jgi:hypothetical protein
MHVKVYISAKLRQRRSWWIIGCYRHRTGAPLHTQTHTHNLRATNSLSGCARLRCGCCRRQSWGERRVSRGAARIAVPGRARCPSPRCSQVCLHGLSRKMVIIASTQMGFLGPIQIGAWFCHHWRRTWRGGGALAHAHTRCALSPSAPQKCVRLLVTLELCNHAALRLLMGLTDILASSSARAGSKGRAEGRGDAEHARS